MPVRNAAHYSRVEFQGCATSDHPPKMKGAWAKALPLVVAVLMGCGGPPAPVAPQNDTAARLDARLPAGLSMPPMRSFDRPDPVGPQRSNAEMALDFRDLFFRLESGRSLPVFTRYEGPVTLTMTGNVPPTAPQDLGRLLARLRSEAGIDIRQGSARDAQITVEFLSRRKMQSLVPNAACFVAPRVTGWDDYRASRRSARVDWATLTMREKATIFIPNDTAPQEIRDCLHEELAQALGPLNDLYRLPDSVFNDDNFHTVLTGFDMLMLRAAYAPELRSGMAEGEVAALLPGVLNRLNPRGSRGLSRAPAPPTPDGWKRAIETALAGGGSERARRDAARRAVAYAEAGRWQDPRRGFSHFAYGRLALAEELDKGLAAFLQAGAYFSADPTTQVQAAHVEMQLAAFALSTGQADEAITLTNRSLVTVMRSENAALLATLLMIKAEALDMAGRHQDATTVRVDSLGWARYGFGSEQAVRARLTEIALLSPANRTGLTR